MLPPSGWRGRLRPLSSNRTNGRRPESTSQGSFAAPDITSEGSERAGAPGRRTPELRPRPRIAPQRDHHRGLFGPAVATVRPAVQATAVQQVTQSPFDLAAPLRRPLPHVGRSVQELDL